MAIISASVLSACGVKPEEREGRALAALSQKYHTEFEITETYPQKFGDLYYEVQAYPADNPQVLFHASINTEDGGLSDTYVERRVCTAIAEKAAENLDAMPAYYYLFAHGIGPQPYTEDAGISIADYAALADYNRFRVEVFAVPEGKDAAAFYQGLAKLFEGMSGLTGSACLYIVDEEQMEAVQAYFEIHDDLKGDFYDLTKGYFALEIPYAKGAIEMDEEAFAAAVKEVL